MTCETIKLRFHKWYKTLCRRKIYKAIEIEESKFDRILGLVDLTSLGVGATLGLGIYVLGGSVSKTTAGPAVTISLLMAAIASGLAGMCYAEFASRVPRAGSAYIYSYVTVGEFCAFIIGWNLILEYAIGAAGVAKGLSLYLDGMIDNSINTNLRKVFPLNVSFLSPYPDFLAFSLVLSITVLLAWGIRESSLVNNFFTIVNLLTILSVIVAGLFKVNPNNWALSKEYALNATQGNYKQAGEGGFIPFGWTGVMAGAAKCFYGFVGFDIIATTGEEAKNPKRNIPLAIIASLFIIFLSNFGMATVLTMVLPYYEQDVNTPLMKAVHVMNLDYMDHILRFGAVCALFASLLGSMFPLSRVSYAMAADGLLFECLARINVISKTPLLATMLSGLLSAIVSGIFDLEQLMDMLSIGTLLAYSIVTMCVILLRFKVEKKHEKRQTSMHFENPVTTVLQSNFLTHKLITALNLKKLKNPSPNTYLYAKIFLFFFCLFTALLCFTFNFADRVLNRNICTYLSVLLAALSIFSFIIIARQPQNDETLVFMVPFVPLLPCMSIAMNIYLMIKLDVTTWIRFIVWLVIGLLVYFFYSVKNSVQGKTNELTLEKLTNAESI